MESLATHLKPAIVAWVDEQRVAIRSLGECYWTMRVDNTSGQPAKR